MIRQNAAARRSWVGNHVLDCRKSGVVRWLGCPAAPRTWHSMANAEANGDTENARNVGQLGSCRRAGGVHELLETRCREGSWLPKNTVFQLFLQAAVSGRTLIRTIGGRHRDSKAWVRAAYRALTGWLRLIADGSIETFRIQQAAEGSAAPDATFCEERAFLIAAMISVCENGFSTNP